jgi:6-phospho-beta-glucosidase
MKISIIGAGSSYTPELFERLAQMRSQLPVTDITLMDIDSYRLGAVKAFCERFARHLGMDVRIGSTTDLDEAVSGSTFVNTQIRVGGNACRVNDEKIPLSMGLLGQETTGAGGFMKALRTIPAMLKIADSIEKNAPDAWMINYTNPTGIVSQAIHDNTQIKCAALCYGGVRAADRAAAALGVDAKDVQYDIFGLNHCNFAYNFRVRGRALTEEELYKVAENVSEVAVDLTSRLKAVPSGYTQYYYHRQKKVEALFAQNKTRGETVLELEKEIYADFLNSSFDQKPPSLKKRGGGGYAAVALSVMDAIYNNRDTWHVINVPNNGVFRFLPDSAVMETAVLVNANGLKPITVSMPPPKAVWGLVSMVKNYEMLTAEAAVTGDRDTAVLALTHHPLICDYDLASELFGKMLEANRAYLPQFK